MSFINSADVVGATFPGNDNAQTNFIFLSFIAALSTPPGFDAKSINKQSFFKFYSFTSKTMKKDY